MSLKQLGKGKEPVTGFSINWTKPGDAAGKMIQAILGATGLLLAFGIAQNQTTPFVGSLLRNVSGGWINPGNDRTSDATGPSIRGEL